MCSEKWRNMGGGEISFWRLSSEALDYQIYMRTSLSKEILRTEPREMTYFFLEVWTCRLYLCKTSRYIHLVKVGFRQHSPNQISKQKCEAAMVFYLAAHCVCYPLPHKKSFVWSRYKHSSFEILPVYSLVATVQLLHGQKSTLTLCTQEAALIVLYRVDA